MVTLGQPVGFRVGYLAQFSSNATMDDTLFPFNHTDLQACKLGLCDDLMPVKSIKSFRGILSSCWEY
jgi:hypothetical protein